MPRVGNKEYPYTPEGYKAARKELTKKRKKKTKPSTNKKKR